MIVLRVRVWVIHGIWVASALAVLLGFLLPNKTQGMQEINVVSADELSKGVKKADSTYGLESTLIDTGDKSMYLYSTKVNKKFFINTYLTSEEDGFILSISYKGDEMSKRYLQTLLDECGLKISYEDISTKYHTTGDYEFEGYQVSSKVEDLDSTKVYNLTIEG